MLEIFGKHQIGHAAHYSDPPYGRQNETSTFSNIDEDAKTVPSSDIPLASWEFRVYNRAIARVENCSDRAEAERI
jgi:hypothetical protein